MRTGSVCAWPRAHGDRAVLDAVEAGVDTLEHVSFLTPEGCDPSQEVLTAIAGGTVFASGTLGADPKASGAPPMAIAAQLGRIHAGHGAPHARGARLVVGSDAGIAPFEPHDVLPHPVAELRGPGLSAGRRCPPPAGRRPGHPDSATGRDGPAPAATPTSSRRRVIRRLTPLPT
ncbi:hypothetical protein SHL15_8424 [Streptomyces hygroscopicus subsp. limoneus]|nr:hypothetical protein SHL15_8424 [Streptomyces hygroscopicus subsp. limoneus]